MFEMRHVSLDFGPTRVLDSVDFRVLPGERIGLLGPSGSGKSTLLKLAAGVLKASQGACINSFHHSLLVFQEPRLLPWRRIHENIQIPLRAAGCTKHDAHRRAHHWLERVGLRDCVDSWPAELSGGMVQRAALARAFALEPDFLLLDEPFSALDPALRVMLGNLCTDIVRDTGAALLCISHHPQELVQIVDRCVLLASGQLQSFEP